jgi:APA family basic amino acid/polyamine antiporter
MGSLSSLGTLVAFSIVTMGVIVLRFKQPNLKRVFKCPGLFIIGPISIVCSCYLMSQLIKTTGYTFLIWNLVGVTFYFVYGVFFRKEKLLNPLKPAEALE